MKNQAGTTLLEVVITTAILTFAILACLQLQTRSTVYLNENLNYSKATFILEAVTNKLRSDRDRALTGYYVCSGRCSVPELRLYQAALDDDGGSLLIQKNSQFEYEITVTYRGRQLGHTIHL